MVVAEGVDAAHDALVVGCVEPAVVAAGDGVGELAGGEMVGGYVRSEGEGAAIEGLEGVDGGAGEEVAGGVDAGLVDSVGLVLGDEEG